MSDERELWTRLDLRTGHLSVWTREPVESVSDAIRKRHPVKIETGEYIHPDEIVRFYPYSLWKEKEAKWERIREREADVRAELEAKAKNKFGTKRRWWG